MLLNCAEYVNASIRICKSGIETKRTIVRSIYQCIVHDRINRRRPKCMCIRLYHRGAEQHWMLCTSDRCSTSRPVLLASRTVFASASSGIRFARSMISVALNARSTPTWLVRPRNTLVIWASDIWWAQGNIVITTRSTGNLTTIFRHESHGDSAIQTNYLELCECNSNICGTLLRQNCRSGLGRR
jgi:hypothetical protein